MRIKRRDFLKAGLAAGALAALDGPILNSLAFAQRGKRQRRRCRKLDTINMSGLHRMVSG